MSAPIPAPHHSEDRTRNILVYLQTCPDLARLCTQNGWIDNATLRCEVVDDAGAEIVAAVTFDEVIMEGAGCIAGRVPCYGRVRLHLDFAGEVRRMDVL